MNNDVLKTFNLCKNYGHFKAVQNVNMSIQKGDIYGFVGENGAGKTTIMRLIAGLSMPASGNFYLFDESSDSPSINNARKKCAGIIEKVSFTKSMSAFDNLKMQCIISNVKKTDQELNELLNLVGLSNEAIASKKVGNFSLGMKQRLGLAMVMVSDPAFILLDEPMNGLDPQGFVEVREAILSLNKKGVTFLISSHILSELDKIATKVGFISHGMLLEELSIDELHQKAKKKIVIKSADVKRIEEILLKRSLTDYKLIPNWLIIYDDIDINFIIKILAEYEIMVDNLQVVEESIETYYLNLISGGHHEKFN